MMISPRARRLKPGRGRPAILPALLFALLQLVAGRVTAEILRVPADHATIQGALDAAQSGDEVLIAPGEYVIDEPLDVNRLHVEGDPSAPPLKDVRVRGEAGAAATIVRMSDTPRDPLRAAVFVATRGETSATEIIGLTLTGGRGQGEVDCSEGCFVVVRGGGVWIAGTSSPRFEACVFERNGTTAASDLMGGGAWCGDESAATFAGCVFQSNAAAMGGGIAIENDAAPTITGCEFRHNSANWAGGALRLAGRGEAIVDDTLVVGNDSDSGGGISADGGTGRLTRVTVVANVATRTAGGISARQSTLAIEDSIVFGNAPDALIDGGVSRPTVRYSLVDSPEVWPGEGNLRGDPLFCGWTAGGDEVWVDAAAPAGGDGSAANPFHRLAPALDYSYALAPGSPCIGSASDGGNRGRASGECDLAPVESRIVHVASGEYALAGRGLDHQVSLLGAGRDSTTLRGTVRGLESGAELAGVTVTDGTQGGVFVAPGRAPLVRDCRLRGNSHGGILASGSQPTVRGTEITGNDSRAYDRGAGVSALAGADITVEECVIASNYAFSAGSALHTNGTGSTITVRQSTIAANVNDTGPVVNMLQGAVTIDSSILWSNGPKSLEQQVPNSTPIVTYSCIDGGWTGTGNIDVDPSFCGWSSEEAHVDASAPAGGDGSAESPYRTLSEALASFDLALSNRSPCRGAGRDGSDMGAPLGSCTGQTIDARTVMLAAGEYEVGAASLFHGVSIAGESRETTVLHGALRGLGSGAFLRDVTLAAGGDGALDFGVNSNATVERCRIRAGSSTRPAIRCRAGARPVFDDCELSGGAQRFAILVEITEGAAPIVRDTLVESVSGTAFWIRDADLTVEGGRVTRTVGSIVTGGNTTIRWSGGTIDGNFDTSGAGLFNLFSNGDLRLDHCTLARNSGVGSGFFIVRDGRLEIRSSIVWDSGNLLANTSPPRTLEIAYSCIEADSPPAGPGNFVDAPLFCGWGDDARLEIAPDPGRAGPTPIASAFDFSVALASDSPCLGAGEGGTDVGATMETCASAGVEHRTVELAPGDYAAQGVSLQRASITGTHASEVELNGALTGLSAGSRLARVTVRNGRGLGVAFAHDGDATIEGSVVAESVGPGVLAGMNAVARLVSSEVWANEGQGILALSGSVIEIRDSTIADNSEAGVYLGGGARTEIFSSLLARNAGFTFHGEVIGGGVYLEGAAEASLFECRLHDNDGAGVWSGFDGTVSLTNCEVVGNLHRGVNLDGGTATILSTTIADNWIGLASANSDWTIVNSIVWDNEIDDLFIPEWDQETKVSATYSTLGTEAVLPGEGNRNEDPGFVRAGEWIGERFAIGDYRLASDAPVIDAGTSESAPEFDLVGRARPCGAGIDPGAYEFCADGPVRFQRGDANADGGTDVSDALYILLYLFADGSPPVCRDAADIEDGGGIDISDPIGLLNYLFADGREPPAPLLTCGFDPTDDDGLTCEAFPPCE